jgi:hypothetical protein
VVPSTTLTPLQTHALATVPYLSYVNGWVHGNRPCKNLAKSCLNNLAATPSQARHFPCPSLILSTALLAQYRVPTLSMTKTTLDRHGHGHFSKPAPLPELSRHWSPPCPLEPFRALHRPCPLPSDLTRPCSEVQHYVEHLACTESASSPQAIRPPPTMPPRHRPCLGFLNVLAQPQIIFLSP